MSGTPNNQTKRNLRSDKNKPVALNIINKPPSKEKTSSSDQNKTTPSNKRKPERSNPASPDFEQAAKKTANTMSNKPVTMEMMQKMLDGQAERMANFFQTQLNAHTTQCTDINARICRQADRAK